MTPQVRGEVEAAAKALRAALGPVAPRVAVILGSGLGAVADRVRDARTIATAGLPGFPAAAVAGHTGTVVAGSLADCSVVVFAGRVHEYEGHLGGAHVHAVRVAAALGAEVLVVVGAVGAINPKFRPGDLVVLDDHVNFAFRNPLVGPAATGEERFPDMSAPYDPALGRALEAAAKDAAAEEAAAEEVAAEDAAAKDAVAEDAVAGDAAAHRATTGEHANPPRAVHRGVYGGVLGPSYETPAEIRMLAFAGADVVGMSLVPEVIAARALHLRVAAVAVVTNPAAGIGAQRLAHAEVVSAAASACLVVGAALKGCCAALR